MPNTNPAVPAGGSPDTVRRILEATAAQLLAVGAGGLGMQDVADRAGVSKGLIHYHFDSKERLLGRLVEWMGVGLAERLDAALDGVAPAEAIDRLWTVLDRELAIGHLRLIGELAHDPAGDVRGAVARVRRELRRIMTRQVEALHEMLALTPRVPPGMLAEVVLAFEQGLASEPADDGPDRRARFDVLWLALLTLTE